MTWLTVKRDSCCVTATPESDMVAAIAAETSPRNIFDLLIVRSLPRGSSRFRARFAALARGTSVAIDQTRLPKRISVDTAGPIRRPPRHRCEKMRVAHRRYAAATG